MSAAKTIFSAVSASPTRVARTSRKHADIVMREHESHFLPEKNAIFFSSGKIPACSRRVDRALAWFRRGRRGGAGRKLFLQNS
jgi:hypothetical protein